MVQLNVKYKNPSKCSICKQWCAEAVTFDAIVLCDDCERTIVQTEIAERGYEQFIREFSETMQK